MILLPEYTFTTKRKICNLDATKVSELKAQGVIDIESCYLPNIYFLTFNVKSKDIEYLTLDTHSRRIQVTVNFLGRKSKHTIFNTLGQSMSFGNQLASLHNLFKVLCKDLEEYKNES